jgi:large subunit ribosomal protein L25
MSALTLRAQSRTAQGKSPQALRRSGTVPAVVYGNGLKNGNLALNQIEFAKVYRAAGESTLVDLVIDEQPPQKVLIQEVQRHPTKGHVLHVDFHQVKMTEKLHTDIPLVFEGEAPAVKEAGGVLVKNIDHVKVEALPTDLVSEIVVPITSLKTFDDAIRISDVIAPKGITILDQPEEVVAVVNAPRSEAELAELEQKVEENVEGVEGVKKEEPAEAAAEDGATPDQPKEKE